MPLFHALIRGELFLLAVRNFVAKNSSPWGSQQQKFCDPR